jgi:ribosomal protein L16 Arg81 hydroxylase
MAYFDQSGDASGEAGRWATFSELPALNLVPGLTFQPITTDSVMTNFVTFEPDAVAHAGDCVVIPPHVPHGGYAGPQGCTVIDVFTPPRAGIAQAMAQ